MKRSTYNFNVYYGNAPMSTQALYITNDAIYSHSTRINNKISTSNILHEKSNNF